MIQDLFVLGMASFMLTMGMNVPNYPAFHPRSPAFGSEPISLRARTTRIGCNTLFKRQVIARHPDIFGDGRDFARHNIDTSILSAFAGFQWKRGGKKMFICIDISDDPRQPRIAYRHLADDFTQDGIQIDTTVWVNPDTRVCMPYYSFRTLGYWTLECGPNEIYIETVSKHPWFREHSTSFEKLYNALLPACQPDIPSYVISEGEINAQGKCVSKPIERPMTRALEVSSSVCVDEPALKKARFSDSDRIEDLLEAHNENDCQIAAWIDKSPGSNSAYSDAEAFKPSLKAAYITISNKSLKKVIQKSFDVTNIEVPVPGQCDHSFTACAFVTVDDQEGKDHSVDLTIGRAYAEPRH